ncbi:PepSY-associated TM helix domain-containing protein [Arcobacter sp.]|uniref:PepSY-associated TM helix domain-containing protein n=1 Tax=Arcobacter sp. TaxID=1872629 RepID=UPI003C76C462
MSNNNWRKPFWKLHLWMGLPFWLIIFFICITGTLAVVSYEITWLFNPGVRSSGEAVFTISELITKIQEQVPGAKVLSMGTIEPYLAHLAYVSLPDSPFARVWIDAGTGIVGEVSTGHTFRSIIRAIHGWLMMPEIGGVFIGWYIVCIFSIPLFISLVTGLIIYRKFWKSYKKPKIHTNKGTRPLLISLHKVGGVWAVWFGLIISITAIWFLVMMVLREISFPFEDLNKQVVISKKDLPLLKTNEKMTLPNLDISVKKANEKIPNLDLVTLPSNAYEPLKVSGEKRTLFFRDTVYINPYNNEILEVRLGTDKSFLSATATFMRALHVGNFGGFWIKILWFIFGLILSGLILSGMLMWTKRTAKRGNEDAI